tara:strand:+ start:257 stop:640 length:384 start_codon:yes stop_codon:yes gene_type:complete
MAKFLFHILNFILIIFYIYPGSIMGYLVYNDFSKQPQITLDFMVSSNHVYAFFLISLVGLIAYFKYNKNFIILYLISISVILEVLHLIIPERSFQFSDLFGNVLGVLIAYFFIKFIKMIDKKKFLNL